MFICSFGCLFHAAHVSIVHEVNVSPQNIKDDMSEDELQQVATMLGAGNQVDEIIDALRKLSGRGQAFFENATVQAILVQGVIDGTVTNLAILDSMKTCTVNIMGVEQSKLVMNKLDNVVKTIGKNPEVAFILRFLGRTVNTDPDAMLLPCQNKVVDFIAKKKFGNNDDVLKEVAKMTGGILDNEPLLALTRAISEGALLGNDLEVRQEIISHFCTICNSQKAQVILARYIRDERFGKEPQILSAIAENLDKFTNPEAQRIIAAAIYSASIDAEPARGLFGKPTPAKPEIRYFGNDTDVLLLVAKKLETFTDSRARQLVACAIVAGVFDKSPVAQKEVARHLHMFAVVVNPTHFTNSKGAILDKKKRNALADTIIADLKVQIQTLGFICSAIFAGKLSVSQELAQGIMIFKTSTSSTNVEEAIYNKFTDPDVRLAVRQEPKKIKEINTVWATLGEKQSKARAIIANTIANDISYFAHEPAQKFLAEYILDPQVVPTDLANGVNNFCRPNVIISDAAAELLKKAWDSGRFIGIDEFVKNQLNNKLSTHNVVLAKKIVDGGFVGQDTELARVVENFCAPSTVLSEAVVTYLMQANKENKFNNIDPELKQKLEGCCLGASLGARLMRML